LAGEARFDLERSKALMTHVLATARHVLWFAMVGVATMAHAGGLTVTGIHVAGVELAPGRSVTVMFIAPAGRQARPLVLRLRHSLPEGSELVTPARTRIELSSDNGNRIVLEPVSRLKINTVGRAGESYVLGNGSARFSVSRALDFFHVNYDKFLAIVRGTQFVVAVRPGKQIDFRVFEGRLLVEREARVRIREGNAIAALRATDVLAEGRRTQISYRLDVEEYLREFNTLKEAEQYFRDKLREDEGSDDMERRLDGINALGVVLHLLGKDSEARELLERGLALAGERADPRLRAIFANNFGAVLQRLGDLEGARAYHAQAIAARRRLYPDGLHADIAGGHNNLGAIHVALGNYEAAAREFDQSLAVQRALYGDRPHAAVAQLLNNIGILERTRGHFEQAVRLHQRALAMLRKLHQGAHPQVAATHARLGAALAARGDYRAALQQHEASLRMLRTLYPGEVHPDVADAYSNLGAIYSALEEPARSVRQHETALRLRQQLISAREHPALALSYANLGAALLDTREYGAALKALREAARQHAQLYPKGGHVDIAINRTNIGAALAGMGQAGAALEEYAVALRVWQQAFGAAPHPGAALTLDRMGSALLAQGDAKRAITRHEEALRMRQSLYPGGQHRAIAASYRELAKAWDTAGDPRKAAEYRALERQAMPKRAS